METPEALRVMRALSIAPVVEISRELVFRAVDTRMRCGVSYWDALILAAAEKARCGILHSEDLNPGQDYHGVTVVNPFDA